MYMGKNSLLLNLKFLRKVISGKNICGIDLHNCCFKKPDPKTWLL